VTNHIYLHLRADQALPQRHYQKQKSGASDKPKHRTVKIKTMRMALDAAVVDLLDNLMYIERMEKKSTTIFVIGAKPPQTLSPKAKKQLSNAKPSKKAHMLAENAARVLAGRGSFSFDKAATTPAQTAKKKSVSVK
jgi:hypothetical protein